MTELFRYAAFISYSSKDERFARRLHRALEAYGVPAAMGKFDLLGGGGKANRVYPVFRDREELSAGDLGERIESALRVSGALIVVCSPHSAASLWVQREIEYFAGLGRSARIFAILPDDAPLIAEDGADATASCLPAALGGETLAADARPGKAGFRNAWLKIVAALIGVTPGQLIDRDKRRRRAQALSAAGAAMAVLAVAGAAAAWVDVQTWRTRLSTYAESLTSQGRPLAALPFAIAGVGGADTLIPARADRANAALASIAGARLILDAPGAIDGFQLSPDGAHLVATDERGAALYAVRPGGAAKMLDFSGAFLLSDDGRVLLAYTLNGSAIYDLRTGRKTPLGPIRIANGIVFAPNGASLFTSGPDYESALYILASPVRAIALGKLAKSAEDASYSEIIAAARSGRKGRFDYSDNNAALIVRPLDGSMLYYDLAHPGPPKNLGPVSALAALDGFNLSRNGATLTTKSESGETTLYDLAQGGAKIPLGALGDAGGVDLSADGGAFVVRGADRKFRVFDAHGGAPRLLMTLDGGAGPILSRNGAALIAKDARGDGLYYDLARPGAPRDVGPIGNANLSFSDNGATLLIDGFDGSLRAVNIAAGGAPLALPRDLRVKGAWLSADGAVLVTNEAGGEGRAFDLKKGGAALALGRMGKDSPIMSADGAAILISGDDGGYMLADRVHGGVKTALGRLKSYSGFDWDKPYALGGGVLAVRDEDGKLAIYDLRGAPPTLGVRGRDLQGAALAGAVCAASGGAVASLPNAARAPGGAPESAALSNSLRGRPWNPCDWRGLASGPEGWAQWVRLIRVRYLGARDYACGETDAAGHVSAARRALCAASGAG